MQPKKGLCTAVLAAALVFCLVATVNAEGPSGCVACHLDEAMLVKNLGATRVKTSALQSGAG